MTETTDEKSPVQLLWTGGWDSTFRLLELLLEYEQPVLPIYLLDVDRRSTRVEMKTMRDIKEKLAANWPSSRELLSPTSYYEIDEIEIDAALTTSFEKIKQRKYLGDQYRWLAAFCKQEGIENLELGIHHDDKATAAIRSHVTEFTTRYGTTRRLDEVYEGSHEHRLFKYFAFPLFTMTKVEMEEIAEAKGWRSLMEMTWFCHSPMKTRLTGSMKPCGTCKPCIYAVDEGMARRIPLSSRLRNVIYTTVKAPIRDRVIRIGREVRDKLRTL